MRQCPVCLQAILPHRSRGLVRLLDHVVLAEDGVHGLLPDRWELPEVSEEIDVESAERYIMVMLGVFKLFVFGLICSSFVSLSNTGGM